MHYNTAEPDFKFDFHLFLKNIKKFYQKTCQNSEQYI